MTDAGAVPEKMRNLNQWICWRYETRDGQDKPTKPPVKPYDERNGTKDIVGHSDGENRETCEECPGDSDRCDHGKPEDSHGYASSIGRHTWRSYDEAVTYHEREDTNTDGVGFVLTKTDMLAGVDFDGVRDPEGEKTNALVEGREWAGETVAELDSYTEVSPSGTGFHTIVVGFAPDGGNKTAVENDDGEPAGEIEIYDRERYLTFTGDHAAETPETVEVHRDELEAVHARFFGSDDEEPDDADETRETPTAARGDDESEGNDLTDDELIAKAKSAENGAKFSALWNGDSSDYPSHSEARLALYNLLAFWTNGDAKRMVRLFQKSSLYDEQPEKCDRLAETEAKKAVKGMSEGFTSGFDAGESPSETLEKFHMAAKGDDEAGRWDRVRKHYDEEPNGVARAALVSLLEDEHTFMAAADLAADEDGPLWIYDRETGTYDETGGGFIRELVERKLPEYSSKHERSEIVNKLRVRNQAPRESFDAGDREADLLCVGNGVLDLDSGDLRDHSAAYRFTKAVPVEYDPSASCDRIDRFLSSVTDDEADKRALYELVGWCLSERYDPPSLFMLVGEGGNGKSVFLNLLRTFLGTENVESSDLHDLASDNNYSVAELVGKMANLGGDIPGKKLRNFNKVKNLTGDDPVTARRPYERPFDFENAAKLIFAVNEPPMFPEAGPQINRRLRFVEFPHRFTADPDDGNPDKVPPRQLRRELTADGELSGLLNRALEALNDLRERGDFAHVGDPSNHSERYEELSDPIARFADECLRNTADSCVTRAAVRDAYTRWCKANDETPKGDKTLFGGLKTSEFSYNDSYRTVDFEGEREYVLDSAALTPAGRERCGSEVLSDSDNSNWYVYHTDAVEKAEDETDPESREDGGTTAGAHRTGRNYRRRLTTRPASVPLFSLSLYLLTTIVGLYTVQGERRCAGWCAGYPAQFRRRRSRLSLENRKRI